MQYVEDGSIDQKDRTIRKNIIKMCAQLTSYLRGSERVELPERVEGLAGLLGHDNQNAANLRQIKWKEVLD